MSAFNQGFSLDINALIQQLVVLLIFGLLIVGVVWRFRSDVHNYFNWRKGKQEFRRHPVTPAMFQLMTPNEFEIWVQGLFQEIGAHAETIAQTGHGDHGIDVIANYQNKKIVIQCKRWFGNSIEESIVRDLYGVMHHGGFDKAVLITTSKFTRHAQEWARHKKEVVLIDMDMLQSIKLDPKRLKKYL